VVTIGICGAEVIVVCAAGEASKLFVVIVIFVGVANVVVG
jgi:hypothetical protein